MKNHTFGRRILITAVVINAVIFVLLSILHFYWAFHGRLWYDAVLPTNSNETHAFKPGPNAAIMIAFSLFLMAGIMAGNVGVFDKYLTRTFFRYATAAIGFLFFLRITGDHKFFGIFKTIRHTRFAFNDNHIFIPVSLFISMLCFVIAVVGKKVKGPVALA